MCDSENQKITFPFVFSSYKKKEQEYFTNRLKVFFE